MEWTLSTFCQYNIRISKRKEWIKMEDKIFVTRSSMPPLEEYVEMIKPLWESAYLTNNGMYHQRLERELKDYLHVSELSLITNGHLALEFAIEAMELSGEVITTPFTFISTVHAIVRKGLQPVFCDISMENYTIDIEKIEELITDKTSAIIVVHPYGQVCDVEAIDKIAEKYSLKVIYDAAHTFGETYKQKSVSSYGNVSVLSFHATKVFHTIEGGAVVYHDEEYGRKLSGLKNFGIRSEELIDCIGANGKMDEFRAAMGICNLAHISEEIANREQVDAAYRSYLVKVKGVTLLNKQKNVVSNFAYFPILIEKEKFGQSRDELYDYLKENGVLSRKYFYPLASEVDCYKNRFDAKETPNAQYIARNVLALPIYSHLSIDKVRCICDLIIKKQC